MSMVTPIVSKVSAFDATTAHTFYFKSSGGSQVVANKITIRNNNTNEIVYENTVTSYNYFQTVEANTLTNGIYYNVTFTTYDSEEVASDESVGVPFWCYTTPTLTFSNIPTRNIVTASNYNFEVEYDQAESELVDYIILYLYDSDNNLISSSGKLYSSNTPPLTVNFTFEGLQDENYYQIQAVAQGIEGNVASSDTITFYVAYQTPVSADQVVLENVAKGGYVNITNALRYINAKCYPNPPSYSSYEVGEYGYIKHIDLSQSDYYVTWYDGVYIPSDHTISLWGRVGQIGRIITLRDSNNTDNYIIVNFVRRIDPNTNTVKDFALVRYFYQGERVGLVKSQYVEPMNNNTYYLLVIAKVDNNISVELTIVDTEVNNLDWEGNSNVEYNLATDLSWETETYDVDNWVEEITEDINNIFPLNTVQLKQGFFHHFNITSDITYNPTYDTVPEWDGNTLLNCDFDDNINGGNSEYLLTQISSVKVKRRLYQDETSNWITLYKLSVSSLSDLEFTVPDYFVKTGTTYEYAIVPVLIGDIEGNYATNHITTDFDGVFITDRTSNFRLYNAVAFGSTVANRSLGVLTPIGSRYPIIISNSENNYKTGSVTGTILGYNYEDTRQVNRQDVVTEINDIIDFLNNDRAKILKDWNGNIWLIKVSSSPQISYNNQYGNGVTSITFNWTEQGEYDNQDDLYENGLLTYSDGSQANQTVTQLLDDISLYIDTINGESV